MSGAQWRKKGVHVLLAVAFSCSALCMPAVFPNAGTNTPPTAAHALVTAEAEARDFSQAGQRADALRELGLFLGTDDGFELERVPTRMEALVMLIRLLGQETEALSGTWSYPFSDVPEWGAPYVGYAYENGLTNGVSETMFGAQLESNADQYLTFVLRALGYSDMDGQDFTWDNPDALARSACILTDAVNPDAFLRADVVLVSYAALFAERKGGGDTLSWLLYLSGAFTRETFRDATGADLMEGRTAETWNSSVSFAAATSEEFLDQFLQALPGLPARITLNVSAGITANYVQYLNANLDRTANYMQSYSGMRYNTFVVFEPGYTQAAQIYAHLKFAGYPADDTILALYARAQELVDALITDGMSAYQKAKTVHDYLVRHTQYDLDYAASSEDVEGVLLNGKGICSGYAQTYKLLLQLSGMDCMVIAGSGMNASGGVEPHAWNLVNIDGSWYHVDVTWDDPIFSGQSIPNYVGYDYFLIGDTAMKKDHAWSSAGLPAAGADWS